MRISRLELFGFKSFCDRTVLSFGPGISCVVGPNGSGKSNVVDALRWVIGEQSAKRLRGGDMLDVIFAGSADRKPVGFAEVQLTLAAEPEAPFVGEYARFEEIQVGRRLHRSGASEYTINGVKVRRRDIVELFLDTGVGNNLYSFIAQGQVEQIVSASPENRRILIDEAAGISKYKARRAEAQQRLEATATQLDRAADVADEMGRRLAVLERQVAKAARFRRCRALIRHHETYLALVKYSARSQDRRAFRERLRQNRGQLAALERELRRRETDIGEREGELSVAETAAGTLRDELAELDAVMREQEGAASLQARRKVELVQQRETAEQSVHAAKASAQAAVDAIAGLESELEGFSRALAEVEGEVRATRERLTTVDGGVSGHKHQLDALRSRRSEAVGKVVATRTQLEAARGRLQALPALIAQHGEEAAARSDARVERAALLQAACTELDGAQAERDQASRERDAVRATLSEAEKALRVCEQQVEAADRGVQESDRELQRLRSGAAAEDDKVRRQAQAEVERVRRATDDLLRQLRQRINDRQQQARDGHRDAVARQRREAAENERRLDGEGRQALRNLKEEQRSELASLSRRHEAEAQQAAAEVEAKVEVAERSAREAAAEEVAGCQQAEQAALDALEQAEVEAEGRAMARREASERKAQLAARLQGLEARRAAVQTLELVADTVADRVAAVDPEGELAALVGDRAGLPVVEQAAQVLEVAPTVTEGTAQLVLLRGGDLLGQLRHADEVDSLEAALLRFIEQGRAAVVRGTGERVGQDGVVTLGSPTSAAEAAIKLASEVERTQSELVEAEAAAEAAVRDEQELRSVLPDRRAALQQARDVLRVVQQRAVDAAQEAGRAAREAATEAVEAMRARHDDEREQLQEAQEAQLDALRRKVSEALAQVRREQSLAGERASSDLEAHLEAIRDEGAAEEIDLQTERREQLEQATAAVELSVEQARDARLQREQGFVDRVEQARSARYEAQQSQQAAREEARRIGEALDAAQGRFDHASQRLHQAQTAVSEHRAELRRLDDAIASGSGSLARLEAEQAELGARAQALEAEQAELESVIAELDIQIAAVESTLVEAEAERERLRGEQAEVEVRRAQLTERLAGTQQRLTDERRRKKESETRATTADEQVAQLDAAIADAEQASTGAATHAGEVKEERGQVWDKLQQERERVAQLKENLSQAQRQLTELRERRMKLERSVHELEAEVQSVQEEVENLRRRISERYQLSLPGLLDRLLAQRRLELTVDEAVRRGHRVGSVVVEGVEPWILGVGMLEDESRVKDSVDQLEVLRNQLQRIGEVNLAALEEHEELAERYQELDRQREDLEQSVASIRAAIAKMNRLCRQRFRDTFDQVNEHFQSAYPRLVGGGTARLSLTDEEDLLQTGVDIFVQPPGKRLQNLTLLSGGEKAMTAIALLLALFKVKPSPFCVLDEVDAPLDEANGTRFNDMLKEMSQFSQFIVITHNRKTMECGDKLFGVTMATPGVSRLVSVTLDA